MMDPAPADLAHDRHSILVTTKTMDVLLDPFQGKPLVVEACICRSVGLHIGTGQRSQMLLHDNSWQRRLGPACWPCDWQQ